MSTMKITPPKGFTFGEFNKETGEVSLIPVEKQYPYKINDVLDRKYFYTSEGIVTCLKNHLHLPYQYSVSSVKRANALLALSQLVELRDAWNKIDGFVPDWCDSNLKYCIYVESNIIKKANSYHIQFNLYFGSSKTRDLFYERFKDLIEEAKEFL